MNSDFAPKIDYEKGTVEGISVSLLKEQFGSPLFVFVERIMREKYQLLQKGLHGVYPFSKIAYSVKTNHIPGICKKFKSLGAEAEVASGFEYWLAKKIGYSDSEIIFNGPQKSNEEILMALRGGAKLNISSWEELSQVGHIAASGMEGKIGIRVNIASKKQDPLWSRFGFNIENGEAYTAFKIAHTRLRGIKPNGIQFHLGTNISDTHIYKTTMEKTIHLLGELRRDFGLVLEYIDAGGGIGVETLKKKGETREELPPLSEFLKSIVIPLSNLSYKPMLILEPGRFLVAEAGIHLMSVLEDRKLSDASRVITVNSTKFYLREADWLTFPICALSSPPNESELARIVGNTCVGKDILGEALLPQMHRGNIICILSAGAYTLGTAGQWIFPRPAAILIRESKEILLLQKKEIYEDMISLATQIQ